MEPGNTSILVNSAGVGCQPALESLIRLIGGLAYSETPDYTRCRDLLMALAKNLSPPTSRHKSVLAEVNSRESPRRKKVNIFFNEKSY